MSIWERQDDESDKAWEAFAIYRDMPPGTRSIVGVAEKLSKHRQLTQRWSVDHDWSTRARASDVDRDRRKREAEITAEIESLQAMRKHHIDMATNLHKFGSQALLYAWRSMQREAAAAEKAGVPFVPALSPRDIKQLIEAGIKLERLSRGEPDTIHGAPSEFSDAASHTASTPYALPKEALPDLTADEAREVAHTLMRLRAGAAPADSEDDAEGGEDTLPSDDAAPEDPHAAG